MTELGWKLSKGVLTGHGVQPGAQGQSADSTTELEARRPLPSFVSVSLWPLTA